MAKGRKTAACCCEQTSACTGLQPIPESYCAVISIFVGAGDMDTGKAVFNSMQRAGHDARPGWLAFVKACFGWG